MLEWTIWNLNQIKGYKIRLFILLWIIVSWFSISVYAQQSSSFGEIGRFGRPTVRDIQLSPKGDQLAVVAGSSVWLYDEALQNVSQFLVSDDNIMSIAWSPDASKIAVSTHNFEEETERLQIWTVNPNNLIASIVLPQTSEGIAFKWHPQINRIIIGVDTEILLWDFTTSTEAVPFANHQFSIQAFAWNADGTEVVSIGNLTAKIWDVSTGQMRLNLEHSTPLLSVSWSLDNSYLAVGTLEGNVHIWDASMGQSLSSSQAHVGFVRDLLWTSNSLISSGGGEILEWNTSTWEDHEIFLEFPKFFYVDIITSPNLVAILSVNEEIQIWNWQTREQVATNSLHSRNIRTLAWHDNGSSMATSGLNGLVKIWDVKSGALLHVLRSDSNKLFPLAWRPNSDQIAAADEKIYIWDVDTPLPIIVLDGHELNGVQREVTAIAWEPTGSGRLASADDKGTIRIWNVDSGEALFTFQATMGSIGVMAWSPDGQKLALENGNMLEIWDATNWGQIYELQSEDQTIAHIVWSPDSSRLATSGLRTNPITIWNVDDGRLETTLRIPESMLLDYGWSLDSQQLIGASSTRMVTWDVTTWQVIEQFEFVNLGVRTGKWDKYAEKLAITDGHGIIKILSEQHSETLIPAP